MKKRILKAFWSKGRKAWLPCTVDDIQNRAKIDKNIAMLELQRLTHRGLVLSEGQDKTHRTTTFRLTEAGKAIALSIITAEAFAKGGAA